MAASASRRKIVIPALASAAIILLAAFTALNAFNLKFLTPATTGDIVVFSGLSALTFLIFLAVLVMLVRNVLKLYADQRRGGAPGAVIYDCSTEEWPSG